MISIQHLISLPCVAWVFDANSETHLRPVTKDDAEFLLDLRLDETLNRHIHVTRPDIEAQRQWQQEYECRAKAGQEFYFIIMHNGKRVGCVRIYDLKMNSFCWGSWLIRRNTPPWVAPRSALMVYSAGFDGLGFQESHFDVRRENASVNAFHRMLGAQVVGEDGLTFYYRYSKKEFHTAVPMLQKMARLPADHPPILEC